MPKLTVHWLCCWDFHRKKLSAVICGKGQLGERGSDSGCVGYAAKGREGVEVVLWLGAGEQGEDLVVAPRLCHP